jgi:hypothetical protein
MPFDTRCIPSSPLIAVRAGRGGPHPRISSSRTGVDYQDVGFAGW